MAPAPVCRIPAGRRRDIGRVAAGVTRVAVGGAGRQTPPGGPGVRPAQVASPVSPRFIERRVTMRRVVSRRHRTETLNKGDGAMAGKRAAGAPRTKKRVSEDTADSNDAPCCEVDRAPSFNETTTRALEDARAGRNLTEYADADELFEKMGIKAGKAKRKA
jgi:hypothetical protein